MVREIEIVVDKEAVKGWLNETETASKVWETLPVTSAINLWGEEIYFAIPVESPPDKAVETVAVGDIAYWPDGQAMCIFLGKTPVSRGNEIRAASPVNIIGRIEEAKGLLAKVKEGGRITVRR